MIIIDAGNGGKDPGASSGDIIEKDYALKISNYMYDRFNELGIPAFITRESDITLEPSDRINTIKPYITSSNDIVISNHLNAGGGDGAEIIYSLRNNDTLSKMILDNIKETGQNVRKWYQRKLPSNQSKDYYYIIRNTDPAESILVEYAFLDSTRDDRTQIKNDWQKWAEAVVKAVADYKGYSYVKPGRNTVNDVYTVQKGDTLWSIAKRFNVGVSEIKSANRLSSNLISVGQKLVIPGSAPSNQTNVTYVVQKGDSLWSIASSNNTTVDEIANLNDLMGDTIYVGQILQIPNTGDSGVIPIDSNNIYTVQKGDTLYSIALRYNTTVSDIMNKNNLTSDILSVGETIMIPSDVESTGEDLDILNSSTYIVQKGDTLYYISRLYGVSIEQLKALNNLTSDILTVGEILTIPNDNTDSTDIDIVNPTNLYVVQKGDNLWQIARKFNTTVNTIRMINNLSSDLLNVGQTLIIS